MATNLTNFEIKPSSCVPLPSESPLSAIEAAVDRIDTREHQLSKIAKDVGSSAVLMSIVLAIVIWLLLVIF